MPKNVLKLEFSFYMLDSKRGKKLKMDNCIFCKIINRDIPSTIVYEDEKVIAFNDVNPAAPIHILVVPKKHIETLLDVSEEDSSLIAHIYNVINKIAREKGFAEKGFRVIANCGKDSGQEIMHIHFHVLAGRTLGPKIVG